MELFYVPKNKKKKLVKSVVEHKNSRRIWLLTDDEVVLDSFIKTNANAIECLLGLKKSEFVSGFQKIYDAWRYEKHGANWKKDSYSLLPF